MLHRFIEKLHQRVNFTTASAHCDIPCKIYDPITAQLAALSVLRFLDLINDLQKKDTLTFVEQAQLIRLINEKETHAAAVKNEVNVIWGDFFKQPQIDQQPDIHQLVHSIMLAGSACKQHTDRDKGEQLLTLVNSFANAFWKAKGIETFRATSPYPPEAQVVYPVLAAN